MAQVQILLTNSGESALADARGTYAQAVKHRQRLTMTEQRAHEEALEWAQRGTSAVNAVLKLQTRGFPASGASLRA